MESEETGLQVQVDPQKVINSLTGKIGQQAYEIATLEALCSQQQQDIMKLQKALDELTKDKEA